MTLVLGLLVIYEQFLQRRENLIMVKFRDYCI